MKQRSILWTRIAAAMLAVTIAVSTACSESPQKRFANLERKIERAKKNYMVALQSGKTGLVESAIKMVAKMKLRVPSADVTELQEVLDEISVTHPSATIRYKAYIASAVCNDPLWYASEDTLMATDEEQFFIAASHRLQQKLFGLNTF